MPSSTTLPCSSTQIRSACRTVEKRCEMRMVVQCRVAARRRSKISASPRTSSWAVGSSSSTTPAPSRHAHERAGQRHPLPLAARQIGAAVVAAGQHGIEAGQVWRRPPWPARRRSPRQARRPARRCRAAAARSRRKSWNTAVRRDRHAATSSERRSTAIHFDGARLAGRRGGTAAWRAWSCRRRSGRRSPATSRRESSGRSRRAPAAPCG